MPDLSQPSADLLPVQRRATLAYRALRIWAVPLLRSLFRIVVERRDRIPTERNYVLIANHLNLLDSFAILAEFPAEPRVHFLGDTTILITRRLQWAMVKSVAGFIPVNRKLSPDTVLFDHVNKCLQRGGVVALYPEGNYGLAEGELLPFKKGFAHFAIDNNVPVLPVAHIRAVSPPDGATNVPLGGEIRADYISRPSNDPIIKLEPPVGVTLDNPHWDGTTFVIEYHGLRDNSLYHAELDQDEWSGK